MEPIFFIKKSLSGQYYCDQYDTKNKKINITKALGGKDNVRRSRYWTHHGGGWWIQEWWIINIKIAKDNLQKQNYTFIIKE